jgi:RNA polymerase sigma-54 factor
MSDTWNMVRMKVRDIIASEDKSTPYSDEAIAEELHKTGTDLPRCTVTRVRQSMNFPSWRGRRYWAMSRK